MPLVVLGGLVPGVLADSEEEGVPEHLGTTDVDIHIDLEVDASADLGRLEQALEDANFRIHPKNPEGWRWVTEVDGFSVKVEFLCDLEDQPAEAIIGLPGCSKLTAVNLRGVGFVAQDNAWLSLEPEKEGDGRADVRFAGLEGYLMAKAHALRERGAGKDYYDFVYMLLFNKLGGPREAAEALGSGVFAKGLNLATDPWPEIRARFTSSTDVGPRFYSEEALQADPGGDPAALRQDAVGAVTDFLNRLQELSREE